MAYMNGHINGHVMEAMIEEQESEEVRARARYSVNNKNITFNH